MLVAEIKQRLSHLSKAERRIAEIVLKQPEDVVHMTTAELARQAQVSDPMVSRFSRSMDCKSFPELKLKLAQDIASKTTYISRSVSSDDKPHGFANKLIDANIAALEYLRAQLDYHALEKAIDLLCEVDHIEIYGMGGCASIAADAQNRLFRLGKPTIAYEDTIKQRMAAAAATPKTAVIALSFTGRTKDMIEAAQLAAEAGGRVLAITSLGSPLANLSEIALTSSADLEDTTLYVPMATRVAVLTVIDMLVTGVALRSGPEIGNRLQKIKYSIEPTKVARANPKLTSER